MITAKNYAAQAERGLLYSGVNIPFLSDRERKIFKLISTYISKASHFALPDGGRILNDGLKGLESRTFLTLPYPICTFEYRDTTASNDIEKVVTIAIEADVAFAEYIMGTIDWPGYTDKDEKCILIFNAIHMSAYKIGNPWILRPWVSLIMDSKLGLSNGTFTLYTQTVIDSMLEEELKHFGSKSDGLDDGQYARTVLELIEALSCRNVSTANHQESSPANAKRIKDGKLPFYETKMLVIDSQGSSIGKSGNGGGSHASPRQHLRRGHIRRLPTHDLFTGELLEGKRNIWVNSCVVGDPAKGSINKSYEVK